MTPEEHDEAVAYLKRSLVSMKEEMGRMNKQVDREIEKAAKISIIASELRNTNHKLKKLTKAQRLVIVELTQAIERRDRGENSDDE